MMCLKRILTVSVLALAPLSATVNLSVQESKQEATLEKPKMLAVLFYADWCNSCKVLEPKLDQVKSDFMGKSVLFTRFDQTDDFTKVQSAHYAALVGLEDLYRDNEGKTGFMLLVNTESKKLLGKITKEKSPDEIRSMLTHALMGHPVSD